MAFVARTDQHGNEIMRVMLSTEPGNRTVASCHNLHINCCPRLHTEYEELGEGRYDHLRRFHSFAEPLVPNVSTKLAQLPRETEYTDAEQSKEAEEELELEQDLELEEDIEVEIAALIEFEAEIEEAEPEPEAEPEAEPEPEEEASHMWNNSEINAHSTLLTPRPQADRCKKIDNFYTWLSAKNEEQQQRVKSAREQAQLEEERTVERTRLAQEKYESWLATKTSQMRRAKSDMSSMNVSEQPQQRQQQQKHQLTPRASLPPEETQRRLGDWEREKVAGLRALRAKREQDEERQHQEEGTRRELCAGAWEQWATEARNRPRPVPMGRGLDSLRGTLAPHFTNPNEWQPLLKEPVKREDEERPQEDPQHHGSSTRQAQPTHASRTGPDYQRLERLAQPRRPVWRPQNSEVLRSAPTIEEEVQSNCARGTEGRQLQPQRLPSVWSNQNARRVRELRTVVNESDLDARMRQLKLHDDQLEQLRQQQHMQNSKALPRRYQEKRDQLKERLKVWVQQGKQLPERSQKARQGERGPIELAREMRHGQQLDRRHEEKGQQGNGDGERQPEVKQQAEPEQQQQQQQRGQRGHQEALPTARMSRKTLQQRTKSNEATCIFKRQQTSRPWR